MGHIIGQSLIVFLLILINGVLAMAEVALISSKEIKLKAMADEGNHGAKTALQLTENPNRFLSAVQIGITLVAIMTGAIGEASLASQLSLALSKFKFLGNYDHLVALIIISIIITYFSVIFGELLPKRLGLTFSEKIASNLAFALNLLAKITHPFIKLLSWSTDFILKIFNLHGRTLEEPPVTEEEIKTMIKEGTETGIFETQEQEMVENVFRLGDRPVSSLMTPRNDVDWLDINDSFDTNWEKVIQSEHTYLPVSNGNLENLLGIISAKTLWKEVKAGAQPELKKLLIKPLFVPAYVPALKSLELFQKQNVSVALVVDEYGSVQGLVTLFDILGSLAGDIPHSPSDDETTAVRREDGSWLFDAALSIDEAKKYLGADILDPEENQTFHSLGGLVMHKLNRVPAIGDKVTANEFRIEVVDMDGPKVDKVLVTPVK